MVRPARQVFVISDLHVGGVYPDSDDPQDRGFRINTQVPQLTAFVTALADKQPGEPAIELVINGDFVDFLAESDSSSAGWQPFVPDPQAAARRLEAIVERDRALFTALGRLLSRGHRLTVTLGNHDIELALPPVRKRLMELIGVEGHHQFHFVYDGEAYVIGDVLIEHGNRYDMFNVVDHDALRRFRSLLSRNQAVPAEQQFNAPTGSHIVASIMNPVKTSYPFIDLLKPETGAAVPILLALEPGARNQLGRLALMVKRARKHRLSSAAMPGFGGDIRAEGDASGSFGQDIGSFDDDMGVDAAVSHGDFGDSGDYGERGDDALAAVVSEAMGDDADGFLAEFTQPAPIGEDISAADFFDRSMGLASLLLARSGDDVERRLPSLLKALRAVQGDKSFDRSIETAREYLDAARALARGGFRCVVFGHTHLAKRVVLEDDALYINTGTWADVMGFPMEILAGSDEAALAKLREFVQDIGTGKLNRWIRFGATYARLDLDADHRLMQAELLDFEGPGGL
jgi:UDP-2,3-diacylglucosamine pyrophosphatase LpxH